MRRAAAGAAVLALVAGCGGKDAAEPERRPVRAEATAPSKAKAQPERGPSLAIRAPAEGSTIHGGAVTVSVTVKRFELVRQRVRPPFPAPVPGQGHVHFYLDADGLPTTHSPPATGTYRSVSETSYTWTGVAPGRHSLAAQLVGRDHAPLRPPAKDRVAVTVE